MQVFEQVKPDTLKERARIIADRRAREAWEQYMKVSSAPWRGLASKSALRHLELFERLWVKAERDAIRLRASG